MDEFLSDLQELYSASDISPEQQAGCQCELLARSQAVEFLLQIILEEQSLIPQAFLFQCLHLYEYKRIKAEILDLNILEQIIDIYYDFPIFKKEFLELYKAISCQYTPEICPVLERFNDVVSTKSSQSNLIERAFQSLKIASFFARSEYIELKTRQNFCQCLIDFLNRTKNYFSDFNITNSYSLLFRNLTYLSTYFVDFFDPESILQICFDILANIPNNEDPYISLYSSIFKFFDYITKISHSQKIEKWLLMMPAIFVSLIQLDYSILYQIEPCDIHTKVLSVINRNENIELYDEDAILKIFELIRYTATIPESLLNEYDENPEVFYSYAFDTTTIENDESPRIIASKVFHTIFLRFKEYVFDCFQEPQSEADIFLLSSLRDIPNIDWDHTFETILSSEYDELIKISTIRLSGEVGYHPELFIDEIVEMLSGDLVHYHLACEFIFKTTKIFQFPSDIYNLVFGSVWFDQSMPALRAISIAYKYNTIAVDEKAYEFVQKLLQAPELENSFPMLADIILSCGESFDLSEIFEFISEKCEEGSDDLLILLSAFVRKEKNISPQVYHFAASLYDQDKYLLAECPITSCLFLTSCSLYQECQEILKGFVKNCDILLQINNAIYTVDVTGLAHIAKLSTFLYTNNIISLENFQEICTKILKSIGSEEESDEY